MKAKAGPAGTCGAGRFETGDVGAFPGRGGPSSITGLATCSPAWPGTPAPGRGRARFETGGLAAGDVLARDAREGRAAPAGTCGPAMRRRPTSGRSRLARLATAAGRDAGRRRGRLRDRGAGQAGDGDGPAASAPVANLRPMDAKRRPARAADCRRRGAAVNQAGGLATPAACSPSAGAGQGPGRFETGQAGEHGDGRGRRRAVSSPAWPRLPARVGTGRPCEDGRRRAVSGGAAGPSSRQGPGAVRDWRRGCWRGGLRQGRPRRAGAGRSTMGQIFSLGH